MIFALGKKSAPCFYSCNLSLQVYILQYNFTRKGTEYSYYSINFSEIFKAFLTVQLRESAFVNSRIKLY